jgi:hypothetical protein
MDEVGGPLATAPQPSGPKVTANSVKTTLPTLIGKVAQILVDPFEERHT